MAICKAACKQSYIAAEEDTDRAAVCDIALLQGGLYSCRPVSLLLGCLGFLRLAGTPQSGHLALQLVSLSPGFFCSPVLVCNLCSGLLCLLACLCSRCLACLALLGCYGGFLQPRPAVDSHNYQAHVLNASLSGWARLDHKYLADADIHLA